MQMALRLERNLHFPYIKPARESDSPVCLRGGGIVTSRNWSRYCRRLLFTSKDAVFQTSLGTGTGCIGASGIALFDLWTALPLSQNRNKCRFFHTTMKYKKMNLTLYFSATIKNGICLAWRSANSTPHDDLEVSMRRTKKGRPLRSRPRGRNDPAFWYSGTPLGRRQSSGTL